MSQHIFKDGQAYYLVEVGSQGVTLKIKEHGWSDTWSLPIDTCDHLGRRLTGVNKSLSKQ
jgi:hypothetical protein